MGIPGDRAIAIAVQGNCLSGKNGIDFPDTIKRSAQGYGMIGDDSRIVTADIRQRILKRNETTDIANGRILFSDFRYL